MPNKNNTDTLMKYFTRESLAEYKPITVLYLPEAKKINLPTILPDEYHLIYNTKTEQYGFVHRIDIGSNHYLWRDYLSDDIKNLIGCYEDFWHNGERTSTLNLERIPPMFKILIPDTPDKELLNAILVEPLEESPATELEDSMQELEAALKHLRTHLARYHEYQLKRKADRALLEQEEAINTSNTNT